ncbi:MAG: histidinol-phosphate transaminase [Ruegeria sp.]|uniref:pyridoxal phosphate-dependent aminotransferase n=1 Tax=Ruegeria sp. TaxID=1879320 RepID=UPI00349EB11A
MPTPTPRPGVDRIKAHMLGAGPSGERPPAILLHSNESVYGASPHALAATRAAVTGIERYLEMPDRLMTPAIAECHGLDAACITVGHGSDDLLARAARAFLSPGDELIRSANGYLKVPNYAHANDAEAVSVPDDDFVPSVDRMIASVTERTRIVYLANPENPAGTYLSGAEIRRLHAALPENVLLILDCAYEEYVTAEDYEPGHVLVAEAKNVIVTRTFSKIYGLAGARVGWVYGNPDIIDSIRRVGVTFPLATPSAAAVLAALEDPRHVAMVRRQNQREREALTARLSAMDLHVVPSQTNFLLVRFPDPSRSAAAVHDHLRARGILVRRFASPAYADCIRITLGFPHENAACADGIDTFLNGGA